MAEKKTIVEEMSVGQMTADVMTRSHYIRREREREKGKEREKESERERKRERE